MITKLLSDTVQWVLKSYIKRGFTLAYFEHELKTWIKAIKKAIDKNYIDEIIDVYVYMQHLVSSFSNNDNLVNSNQEYPYSSLWENEKNIFTEYLLDNDLSSLLELVKKESC